MPSHRVTQTSRALVPGVLVVAAALGLAACSGTGSPSAGPGSPGARSSKLTVLAAASLKDAFGEIATAYQSTHPGVEITLSFGGSSTLAAQITQGAPADVFAAASEATMRTVVDAGQATKPVTFARNRMEIVTPPGNPAGVHSLADLQRAGLKVVLCQAAVPCGAASQQIFTGAGLTVTPVSQQNDVRSVLTAVELGEADAGLVYVTDAAAAGSRVTPVPVPDAQNATTSYPIAPLTASRNAATARDFVAFVSGPDGRRILVRKGFGTP